MRKRAGIKNSGPGAQRARAVLVRILEIAALAAGLLATAVVSAAITFTLAVRGNEVTVPDLAGASVEGAGESLRREELQLVVEGSRFHASVPPDFISEQIPAPGTTLKKGRSVRVWVSLGPQKHSVPRIEGETLQSAQLILEQNGFTLGRVVEIHSEVYAPDTVVAQSPSAYEDVAETTEVAVLLSRGYLDDAYVMPDFIGRNYVEILDQISRGQVKISQVRLVEYPGVPKNVIVRQVPAPGVKVFKRDRIVLYLSKGA
jgi:beta-lactam-binding protein with PASTA domain